eukprot:350095-Chlamydomonas_euryale.AAC.3
MSNPTHALLPPGALSVLFPLGNESVSTFPPPTEDGYPAECPCRPSPPPQGLFVCRFANWSELERTPPAHVSSQPPLYCSNPFHTHKRIHTTRVQVWRELMIILTHAHSARSMLGPQYDLYSRQRRNIMMQVGPSARGRGGGKKGGRCGAKRGEGIEGGRRGRGEGKEAGWGGKEGMGGVLGGADDCSAGNVATS